MSSILSWRGRNCTYFCFSEPTHHWSSICALLQTLLHAYITPFLMYLSWLLVKNRIQKKIIESKKRIETLASTYIKISGYIAPRIPIMVFLDQEPNMGSEPFVLGLKLWNNISLNSMIADTVDFKSHWRMSFLFRHFSILLRYWKLILLSVLDAKHFTSYNFKSALDILFNLLTAL